MGDQRYKSCSSQVAEFREYFRRDVTWICSAQRLKLNSGFPYSPHRRRQKRTAWYPFNGSTAPLVLFSFNLFSSAYWSCNERQYTGFFVPQLTYSILYGIFLNCASKLLITHSFVIFSSCIINISAGLQPGRVDNWFTIHLCGYCQLIVYRYYSCCNSFMNTPPRHSKLYIFGDLFADLVTLHLVPHNTWKCKAWSLFGLHKRLSLVWFGDKSW